MKPLIHSSLGCFVGRICIDLDDFDRIVDLLRQHCRSVQIVAADVLIEDSSQFQGLRDRLVQDLEIQAHDPFVRIRFGGADLRPGRIPPKRALSEVVSDPDNSVAASLHAQIKTILNGARRRGPISILGGMTGEEKRSFLIAGLMVGLSLTLYVGFSFLFVANVRDRLIDVEFLAFFFTLMAAMVIILLPHAPVLLLRRGRATGRPKLEPKPDPIADL